MIPHKLQLKNFLSYGPQLQTVDFSGHSLICLSGKNGHGKSALLDAMTWAVWGQARKIIGAAKADQGLLRLGQTQMLVIFDFEFNNTLYRIRREYMETFNKPVAVLEFGIIDHASGEFIPLTDKTIRTTQAKIEQTLRLDFEAFANSAFLRQGNSNEFSKKTPKDRKHILASILGLDQYEAIRKQALEKIKDASLKKNGLVMVQEKRMNELATQEILHQELSSLEHNMSAILDEENAWNKQQAALKKIKLQLNQEQNSSALVAFQKQQLLEVKQTHVTHLATIRNEWRKINAQKQGLHNFHQLEQDKKNSITEIAHYQKIFQSNLEYKEELLRLNQELNAIEQKQTNEQTQKQQMLLIELERLSADQKNKQNIITMLEDEHKKNELEYVTLTQHITHLSEQVAQSTITELAIKQAENILEKKKTSYQSFVSLGNWISSEIKNIVNKKNLIHKDDPSCPLCEQNLSASRRKLLNSNFNKQESFLVHRLQRLKRIIPSLKEHLLSLHEQLLKNKEALQLHQQLQTKIKELTTTQDKIAITSIEITKKISLLQQETITVIDAINALNKKITLIAQTNTLAHDEQYQLLTQNKAVMEKKLNDSVYNPEVYAQKQAALHTIEKQLADYESLQKDIAQQTNRKADIQKICATLKQLKAEELRLSQELNRFKDVPEKIADLLKQEKEHDDTRAIIRNKKDTFLQTKGSIETKQKRLDTIKYEHEQEQKTIAALDDIIQDYNIICTATGKDGIQALLIEEAIPEIEQEANLLLSQLTNNQAQIFIESLRDLKKGGTKETLDIKISDQNGIRPYELFSGGEAFRIDFALRIAISKLLARRAGTALQTLIIDEGFGSQDEEGLGYIMDALHVIQNNFSKIIVVSHLPAMKDQFPVQFVIHKGVQGSMVTVIEQG